MTINLSHTPSQLPIPTEDQAVPRSDLIEFLRTGQMIGIEATSFTESLRA
jgi:hypothetical protein